MCLQVQIIWEEEDRIHFHSRNTDEVSIQHKLDGKSLLLDLGDQGKEN